MGSHLYKEQPMGKKQAARNFGELYANYRVPKSFFGHSASVLKSGIQKYGRRAEVDTGAIS